MAKNGRRNIPTLQRWRRPGFARAFQRSPKGHLHCANWMLTPATSHTHGVSKAPLNQLSQAVLDLMNVCSRMNKSMKEGRCGMFWSGIMQISCPGTSLWGMKPLRSGSANALEQSLGSWAAIWKATSNESLSDPRGWNRRVVWKQSGRPTESHQQDVEKLCTRVKDLSESDHSPPCQHHFLIKHHELAINLQLTTAISNHYQPPKIHHSRYQPHHEPSTIRSSRSSVLRQDLALHVRYTERSFWSTALARGGVSKWWA